jgi:predicted alpha/beta-fold hydrolase
VVRLATAFPFSSGHVQTLFPPFFRPMPKVRYERERLETSDGDFVDLDWSRGKKSRGLVFILHGLEGHSRRKYVLGMVKAARLHGFDAVAMNFRGCSGEPNRKVAMYHSGWTLDLHESLLSIASRTSYSSVHLIGFSLGGNVLLKYLGENPAVIPRVVGRSVAISVPCDLEDSSRALARPQCALYSRYLLDQLRKKIIEKGRLFPGKLDLTGVEKLRTFRQFDDRFTAPLHGFRDALDYWRRSSSLQFLAGIDRPACILNAVNDPFLGPKCYPVRQVRGNANLTLLTPATGGHVGFVGSGKDGLYWSEWTAMRFLLGIDGHYVQK